jgi:hypothetical protein
LGLTPVAGLLHRNQTLFPTRPAPSGLCTGGPSPSGPGSILAAGSAVGPTDFRKSRVIGNLLPSRVRSVSIPSPVRVIVSAWLEAWEKGQILTAAGKTPALVLTDLTLAEKLLAEVERMLRLRAVSVSGTDLV